MFYSSALFAIMMMAGSTDAFAPVSHSGVLRRTIKMAGEDPWFPNSVTSNTVAIETLK
jgi:hypothetical protein